jgi:hypothetical protein
MFFVTIIILYRIWALLNYFQLTADIQLFMITIKFKSFFLCHCNNRNWIYLACSVFSLLQIPTKNDPSYIYLFALSNTQQHKIKLTYLVAYIARYMLYFITSKPYISKTTLINVLRLKRWQTTQEVENGFSLHLYV